MQSSLIDIRGRHGFSKGRVFASEDGRGLFRLGLAHHGKQEYSSSAKASPCQFFYCGGEEQACGGLRVRIILSALLFLSTRASFLVILASLALHLPRVTFHVTTFFIYSFSMHKSSKWASHHLHTTSSLIGSLFAPTIQTSLKKISPWRSRDDP